MLIRLILTNTYNSSTIENFHCIPLNKTILTTEKLLKIIIKVLAKLIKNDYIIINRKNKMEKFKNLAKFSIGKKSKGASSNC